MAADLPPIVKAAERCLVEVNKAVLQFSRAFRHELGADLRRQSAEVSRLCDRAWRDRSRQLYWTDQLVWSIDELKCSLRLGSQLHAFRSFAQFEVLIRLAEDLGRQAGAWKRHQLHPKGQSSSRSAAPERAQTWLTTRRCRAQASPAAAQSAAGIGVPCTEAHQRPSTDAGAFFGPAKMGQLAQWRAVCGGRKARRPSDRYANRAPSVSLIGVRAADLNSEDRTMSNGEPARRQREDRAIRKALRILEARWAEPTITFASSDTAAAFFTLRLSGLDREVFEVAFLDSRHCLIAAERLFLGTINAAEVHPRVVVKRALEHNAAAVIAAHNHPSGNIEPSHADRALTRQLRAALALVDVRMLDHIVVGRGRSSCIPAIGG